VCIRLRMHYEEAILTSAFPEYADYRRRVGPLMTWPGAARATVLAPQGARR
jgi:protein-S-isoprenylcysteine O-methyltransferase Ste14